MTKILIAEDEALSARKLKKMLEDIVPQFEVVEITDSVSGTLAFLKQHQVDLIFLDIHLSDGNSFDIFDQINIETPIIFTTAFDQYALSAFQQNSIDYLLKPIGKQELQKSIDKFLKYFNPKSSEATEKVDYKALSELVAEQMSPSYRERFMVYVRDELRSIKAEEVAFFFAESRAVFMTTLEGQTYDLSFTLEQLEKELNPKQFIRVNRKYLLHREAIQQVIQYSKSKLKISTTPEAPTDMLVPAEKVSKFKDFLAN
ncbi:LytTR family DNA-binding domain-containing protein [Algivirga pacifica]|uniref:LytTR family DNA-binding domain-containing protein n=1 Tax=Algivirga pacifica TaxID=1162670 RepID=A0ABP9D716_9BACT